jgi:hypothetical protein
VQQWNEQTKKAAKFKRILNYTVNIICGFSKVLELTKANRPHVTEPRGTEDGTLFKKPVK